MMGCMENGKWDMEYGRNQNHSRVIINLTENLGKITEDAI